MKHLWPHLWDAEDAKKPDLNKKKCREILIGTIPHLVIYETRYRRYWKHIYFKELSKWIFEMETHGEKCMFGSWVDEIGGLADTKDLFREMTVEEAKELWGKLEKRMSRSPHVGYRA
jgi:hypothetical protein